MLREHSQTGPALSIWAAPLLQNLIKSTPDPSVHLRLPSHAKSSEGTRPGQQTILLFSEGFILPISAAGVASEKKGGYDILLGLQQGGGGRKSCARTGLRSYERRPVDAKPGAGSKRGRVKEKRWILGERRVIINFIMRSTFCVYPVSSTEQISRAPLNTSPTKQLYSFSRNPRFDNYKV